jgi:K+/H+ antiporter YhaU regulatory subunit KhtT
VQLGEAQLRDTIGITVLAVRRADGKMPVNPHGDVMLNAGNTLIALGARSESRSGRAIGSEQ